jgi:ADP-ribose pyrophosphatase YjhB (NUDIX family)
MNFAIAVKALIVKNKEILLLKRKSDNPHAPNQLDIVGGRLDLGEDPKTGLQRECSEEIGSNINIISPIGVNHFTRDDGQAITMIIFLCELIDSTSIRLSDEHNDYIWVDMNSPNIPNWLNESITNISSVRASSNL